MIANLIDPCGTLGDLRNKIVVLLGVILSFTNLTILLSFVIPARVASPVLTVLFMPVILCNARGLQSLLEVDKMLGRLKLGPAWIPLVALAVLALCAWLDVSLHQFPDHYLELNTRLAFTPVFREVGALYPLFGVFSVTLLVARARRASGTLACAMPGAA